MPLKLSAEELGDPAALPLAYVRKRLRLPYEIPLLPCVATDKESVKQVLLALLTYIEQSTAAA